MKKSKGTVSVQSFRGRLRLRLPRHVFGGEQKYLTLGLADTSDNRRIAEAKAKLIESDITLERFDSTLLKYQPPIYLSEQKKQNLQGRQPEKDLRHIVSYTTQYA